MNDLIHRRNLTLLMGIALVVGLFPFLLNLRHRSGHLTPPAARHLIPPFTLTSLDAPPWSLSNHRGQILLINYWATWCGPCREEIPGLIQIAHDNASRNVSLLGISLDKGDPATVRTFVHHLDIPYPIAFPDPLSLIDLGLSGIPTTILLDRSGRVARIYVGAIRRADFQTDIDTLDRESRTPSTAPAFLSPPIPFPTKAVAVSLPFNQPAANSIPQNSYGRAVAR